jgi:hypothetical protein
MINKLFILRGSCGKYPYDHGSHVMGIVNLYAYADESGIENNSSYCVVAGYLASQRVWENFRKEWKFILDEYHVSEFHSKEFFKRYRGPNISHGQYVGWSTKKASDFELKLINCINRHHLNPTGSAIDIPAFNKLTLGERRFLTGALIKENVLSRTHHGAPGKPWFVPFRSFVQQSLSLAEDGTMVHLRFDEQNQMNKNALQIHKDMKEPYYLLPGKEKLGDLIFGDSKVNPELQAADMFSYSVYLYLRWKKGLININQEGEAAVLKLFKRPGIGLHDAEQLEAHLKIAGPEFRDYLHSVNL